MLRAFRLLAAGRNYRRFVERWSCQPRVPEGDSGPRVKSQRVVR
jgi:hypothetical protein